MKQWYAKELSELTQVSVRTLHHYDKIGLLQPQLRLSNGYRLYSEKDLLKLQQIIALKYFGFELSQIKTLLTNSVNVLEHFAMQSHFLHEKAEALVEASNLLKSLMSTCSNDESIPWEKIIQLIEVYRMTQQLEHSWVKEIFNTDELKQYASFEANIKSHFTEEERNTRRQLWHNLMEEINKSLKKDPSSALGIHYGQRFMEVTNRIFGKEHANLRTKMFEQGFGEGKGLQEFGLTPEMVSWIEKAVDAYWQQRLHDILAQVTILPSSEVVLLWNKAMEELYGDDSARKSVIIDTALNDDKVSHEAKSWMKKTFC